MKLCCIVLLISMINQCFTIKNKCMACNTTFHHICNTNIVYFLDNQSQNA